MIDISVSFSTEGLGFEGTLIFNKNARGHQEYFWKCINPGIKNPELSFYTKKNGVLIISITNTNKEKFDGDILHDALYAQRKNIYHQIALFIEKERDRLKRSTG